MVRSLRLTSLHPRIDRAVRKATRSRYLRRLFAEGPRRRGSSQGCTFVVFNHNYDLDVDALCEAPTAHTIWVIDPFAVFNDVELFFPPEERDLAAVYGQGAMAGSIERYKKIFIAGFAERLIRETKLDAFITPSDTFYYLRPLIEELRARNVPTIVQDKEGTIAPTAIMDDHARILRDRYPPIADQFYFWSETHLDFWRRVGVDLNRAKVLGQPRSDFFFHPERWPSKASLGLSEGKQLVLVFTYDADTYARSTEEANKDRPWIALRSDMHNAARALARERPNLEIVIKAHPQQAELAEVAAELATHPEPNVKLFTGAATASRLMVNADVIVGFQSTAMIEAMLTSKPVIYAGWGDWHSKFSSGIIPIHLSNGCALPSSRSDLDAMLRAAVDGRLQPSSEMMEARKAFTDRYFYDADGHCAERILNSAAEFVTARRAASTKT